MKKDLKKGLSRVPPKTNLMTEREEEEKKEEGHGAGLSPLSHPSPTPAVPRRGQTIYSHQKGEEVTLDDFLVKKVIGKGSFGKVFLVEKKSDHKVYAMKSIRKDILI